MHTIYQHFTHEHDDLFVCMYIHACGTVGNETFKAKKESVGQSREQSQKYTLLKFKLTVVPNNILNAKPEYMIAQFSSDSTIPGTRLPRH